MKAFYILLICFTTSNSTAQLVFKNNKSTTTNITKFIVNHNNTEIYTMVANKEVLSSTWNKVPSNFSSEDAQNQFKMTVSKVDKVAKRTYEIHYSLYRQTNKHVGYIKSTYEYFDNRPKKIIEEYFTI